MEVFFSGQSFRDMILFSGRFANSSILEEEWKNVYGFLIGKVEYGENEGQNNNESFLLVKKLIPMVHGTRKEVYFNEQEYAISESIMDEIFKAGMFVVGWFHSHPGLGLFLSETDLYNQLGFQSGFNDAIAAVFDFTMITEKSSGLKIFKLDDVIRGIKSSYSELPYQIIKRETSDDYFIARSFVNISNNVAENKPLIKEAGEILRENGTFKNLFKDLTFDNENRSGEPIRPEELEKIEIPNMGKFNEHVTDLEKEINFAPDTHTESETFDDSGFYEILENYSENDWEIRSLRERIERAKENKENNEHKESTGYLMVQLANLLIEKSISRNEALGYLESAEEEFAGQDDKKGKVGLATVKNELGLFYEEIGDYNTALNNFETTLKIFENLKDEISQVKVINNIGSIYIRMKFYDKAYAYYKKAYSKASENGYTMGIIATLNNTVDVLLFLHNFRATYSTLMLNYQFFTKNQNKFGIGITLSKFGILYYMQGEFHYPLSEKYFRMALDIKIKNKRLKETIEDWVYLSKIYSYRNELNSAEICLVQGLNIVRTYELSKEEGNFYNLLGDLYYYQNKIDDSSEYYKLALENFRDFGDEKNIVKIYEKLSDLNLKQIKDKQGALNHLYSALEIYRSQNYSKKVGETLMKIADIHIDLTDESSAVECLLEARNIYKTLYDEFTSDLITAKLNSLGEK
ncbi:MAG: hypothetical protein ACTSWY_07755 [Promethearchaeota archaeon]